MGQICVQNKLKICRILPQLLQQIGLYKSGKMRHNAGETPPLLAGSNYIQSLPLTRQDRGQTITFTRLPTFLNYKPCLADFQFNGRELALKKCFIVM